MNKFIRISLESEKMIHLAEHETLLSFYDDEANEAFHLWWYLEGSKMFNNWLKHSDEYSKLANCSPQEALETMKGEN